MGAVLAPEWRQRALLFAGEPLHECSSRSGRDHIRSLYTDVWYLDCKQCALRSRAILRQQVQGLGGAWDEWEISWCGKRHLSQFNHQLRVESGSMGPKKRGGGGKKSFLKACHNDPDAADGLSEDAQQPTASAQPATGDAAQPMASSAPPTAIAPAAADASTMPEPNADESPAAAVNLVEGTETRGHMLQRHKRVRCMAAGARSAPPDSQNVLPCRRVCAC